MGTTAKGAAVGFAAATGVATVAALRLSLDVLVFGVLALGVVHIGFEMRYVVGRYRPLLQGRVLIGVSAALVLIVLGRLLGPGEWWPKAEIVILAGALVWVLLVAVDDPRRRRWGLLAVGAAGTLALVHAESWFVAQAWLHNLIPAVFVWQWSAGLARDANRHAVRLVTIAWVALIPIAMLVGLFDPWLQPGTDLSSSLARGAGVTTTVLPVGSEVAMAPRLIAAFAFLQMLHYTVWLWHFPRVDRVATAAFTSTPVGGRLRGARLPVVLVAVSLLLALVAWFDYRSGRGLYTSLAAYHAYLEYPVLLALVVGVPAASVERPLGRPTTPVAGPALTTQSDGGPR